MRVISVAFLLNFLVAGFSQSAELGIDVLQEDSGTQTDQTRFVLRSRALNRTYIVEVTAPQGIPSEARGIPEELIAAHRLPAKVPVIYALDGGLGILGAAARFLGFNFAMSPAYVVSIDYSEPWGPEQWRARSYDLLHVQSVEGDASVGGGGARFEDFLMNELRPFIESKFPVDPQRSILAGHSLGAVFATAVLVHRPGAFRGFLIASPSFRREPTLLAEAGTVARRGTHEFVFISAGAAEEPGTVRDARRLAATLSSRRSSLVVRNKVFPGFEHVDSFLPAISEGLPFLLSPKNPDDMAEHGLDR